MPETFLFDLARTTWRPKTLRDLVAEVGRAFEVDLATGELGFVGCDSGSPPEAPLERLDSDDAVLRFVERGTSGEVDSQVIRTELPDRVSAELRRPRKLALLASGRQVSKFSGVFADLEVELSLKLFDCGHFRAKEGGTRSASASPTTSSSGGVVIEGRWQETETGLSLEVLVRFQEPSGRRRPLDGAGLYDFVPVEERIAELGFVGRGDDRLAGEFPIASSTAECGRFCRVELQAETSLQRPASAAAPQADDDDEEYRHLLKEVPPRKPPPPPKSRDWDDDWDNDEPRWPMYLGIVLFIIIILTFAWVWYEEQYAPETPTDFEEL